MFDAQAIIAEATAEAPKAEANAPEQEAEATSTEAQATETEITDNQESDDISKKPDSELTPEQLAKREANRQSHLNRKLAKQRLREENRDLKTRLEKLEQQFNQPKQQSIPNGKPDITQFEDHLEYMEALADWKLDQKLNAAKEQSAPKVDNTKVQRLQEMATHEAELAKKLPDYERLVYQENSYIMSNMPKHVAEALLDAEDASLALYTLAKEGKLEDLEDLDGKALDRAIAKAEERGAAYLMPAKTISTAPPPIESLRGTGRATKDLNSMSVEELMKKFNR